MATGSYHTEGTSTWTGEESHNDTSMKKTRHSYYCLICGRSWSFYAYWTDARNVRCPNEHTHEAIVLRTRKRYAEEQDRIAKQENLGDVVWSLAYDFTIPKTFTIQASSEQGLMDAIVANFPIEAVVYPQTQIINIKPKSTTLNT